MEGNKKEPGIILLCADQMFTLLERKKYEANTAKSGNQTYNFGIRMRYVEIYDEDIIDLLAPPNTAAN